MGLFKKKKEMRKGEGRESKGMKKELRCVVYLVITLHKVCYKYVLQTWNNQK